MTDQDQTGLGWTVVLRRQPVRIVAGQAEGGYTDAYELVCWEWSAGQALAAGATDDEIATCCWRSPRSPGSAQLWLLVRPLTRGAKGTRTPGLLDANQTLFQLSYSPEMSPAQATRSRYVPR